MSHAKEIRPFLRRLDRRRKASPQILQNPESGAALPAPAAPDRRLKKSPSLGTVAQICQAWAEAHKTSSHRRAARDLAQIAGSISPHELTPLHFQSIHARWKAQLRPGSVYDYNRSLLALVRNIAAMCNRPDLPGQVPRARLAEARRTIADPGDIDKLLAAAPNWMKVLILLAADAGLRRGDAMRVSPEHYDAEKNLITITQQKTDKSVTIPVTERLAYFLEHSPSHNPTTPYFQAYREKPIKSGGVDRAWQVLKEKAGVKSNLWMHDLRRTLAVSLYEVSKDLRVVEQMLGHRHLGSTLRYLEHRDPAKLKPYLDAIHRPTTKVIQ